MPGIIKKTIPEESKTIKKPCKDCPYSTSVTPGELGGSSPETYIGQGHGPFYLPCHKTCDFSDPNWKDNVDTPKQCAGAAIYRANTNRDILFPDSLLKLPKSDLAFGSPEELYAHHKQITIEEAREFLKINNPDSLMMKEYIIALELQKQKK